MPAVAVLAGFVWFVAISWTELSNAVGTVPLFGLLAVGTLAAAAWSAEADKCARLAPPAEASQQRCLEWLEGRREWWTLGLSHRDAGSR